MARSFLIFVAALFFVHPFFTFSYANLQLRGVETANTGSYPLQNAQQQQQQEQEQQLPLVDTEAAVPAQATQVDLLLEAQHQARLARMQMVTKFFTWVIILWSVYNILFGVL